MLQTPPIVLKTLNEFLHQNNDQTGFLHTHWRGKHFPPFNPHYGDLNHD
jgi:hypothetical protein